MRKNIATPSPGMTILPLRPLEWQCTKSTKPCTALKLSGTVVPQKAERYFELEYERLYVSLWHRKAISSSDRRLTSNLQTQCGTWTISTMFLATHNASHKKFCFPAVQQTTLQLDKEHVQDVACKGPAATRCHTWQSPEVMFHVEETPASFRLS